MKVPYLSEILLSVFVEILEGSYVPKNFKKVLNIEDEGEQEYEFSPNATFDGQEVRRAVDEEQVVQILPDFREIVYDDASKAEKWFIKDFIEYAKH